jgi:hypothetical protein
MRHQFLVGFLLVLICPTYIWAQNIGQSKKGVVKIRATVDGKARVGAGVIVKLEKGAAYIVTASHVIEGEEHPQVMFYSEPHRPFKAKILGLEGGDPRGLAALRVEGPLPDELHAMALDQTATIDSGEAVMLIGFPLAEGNDWTVTTGTISGRKGSALSFAGIADEGNSGGPVLFQGKVVGIVTQVGQKFNYAAPAMTARFAIEGWGVRLPEKIAQEETKTTTLAAREFEVLIGQVYSHPTKQSIAVSFDGFQFSVILPNSPQPRHWFVHQFPEGQWMPLGDQSYGNIPIAIMRRGNRLLAQWEP